MTKTEARRIVGKAKHEQWERALMAQIIVSGLPAPLAECRNGDTKFHPIRKWRADFLWPARHLIVEVEGGTWSGGRHVRGTGYADDCEKYNEAAILGYSVLRFTSQQVRDGYAIDAIRRWFATHAPAGVNELINEGYYREETGK
jgi:hypothetical protein